MTANPKLVFAGAATEIALHAKSRQCSLGKRLTFAQTALRLVGSDGAACAAVACFLASFERDAWDVAASDALMSFVERWLDEHGVGVAAVEVAPEFEWQCRADLM